MIFAGSAVIPCRRKTIFVNRFLLLKSSTVCSGSEADIFIDVCQRPEADAH